MKHDSRALSRAEVRAVDERAMTRYAIPGIVLMENAGLRAAERILRLAPPQKSVAILCGGGNNGGDGYVIARQLELCSVPVRLLATHSAERLTGDAAVNRAIVERMGLAIEDIGAEERAAAADFAGAGVIVDALLGTGFQGEVRAVAAAAIAAIERARAAGAMVVAVDLPSGLDCDTGEPSNATVRADHTLTFAARKVGFDRPGAGAWTGAVQVLSIGAPIDAE
ncbi:MAG: NAD(P)H-hydrate epimerase [bacterium]|nr:NAD(P)H-hydrate epimerase [bacterium]